MVRHKMVVVGGVRYRPEDAPTEVVLELPEPKQGQGDVPTKARRPAPRAKGSRSRGTST